MDVKYLKRKKLPDAPGVYIFRDYRKRPLYIGRATSLKDRVRSYFGADLIETRGPRLVDMVTKARSLTFETTGSVLEAIILESRLIKQYQPYYNVAERDDKSDQYVVITDEDWPRVFLMRARDYERRTEDGKLDFWAANVFGPFPESGLIKAALKILRRLFPFRDKKAKDPRHEEFYRSIGQSPERTGRESKEAYERTVRYLRMFFEGRKSDLRAEIESEMNSSAAARRFEEADRMKRLLFALDHINDISLIKSERHSSGSAKSFRMEAYDIAHLAGTNVVGAMTVSINGQLVNSEYRKFRISKQANNDIAGLVEILMRRLNHSEWPYPDLIVVDGNENQMKAAQNVLRARRIEIPVVAVTKDDRHKAARLLGLSDLVKKFHDEIIAVNAEGHRFAIAFHRKRRAKNLLNREA